MINRFLRYGMENDDMVYIYDMIWKNTDIDNQINNFHLALSVSGSLYYACRLTLPLTAHWHTIAAIVNVISNTCAFYTMTI